MDKTLFDDLVQSLKEAKALARRKKRPELRHTALPATDVQAVRERTGLSQSEFAQLMRVSTRIGLAADAQPFYVGCRKFWNIDV